MSSDDEKAAIYARLYDCIKGKEPGWQEESLWLFLLKASETPAPEYNKTVERAAESGSPATPPVIYLPSATASEADTAAGPGTKAGSAVRSAATPSAPIDTPETSLLVPDAQAIGRGLETGDLLSISDTARRSGLYILGRSGSGKTELLKRMILSDIDRGHGVFFVDPHGDEIDDLITRLPSHRIKDVISIDPDLENESFGINLLSCNNIASWSEREATYNRAKTVFDKLWKNMPEELPWLQLIIEHTLPVFIYNQDYTLAEAPRFLSNTDFRRFLLRSVTHDPDIVDFWESQFHQKQAEAAITRIRMLLGRPPVRDIVSQEKSTINFARIFRERQILFVKLSANLSADTKKFIGTILISELLHAVRNRAEAERHQFCIFVDEFQHFSASDDFATLINEARKFSIATTVAHQERFGQFADDRKLLGATDAAANKILFQLGGKDAQEQALEFALKPPTETRREQQYAISQNPVPDLLLRGHIDPDIRRFINKYLRYLDDKRDDIKADMEGEKFAQMIELDTAAFYGAEAQEEGVYGASHYSGQVAAIAARQTAILSARMHSIKLLALHGQGNRLRVTMRQLNRFLIEVMEGEKRAKQEEFADFLIDLAASYSAFPEAYAEVLGLYIKCTYGDPNTARVIPFAFARKYGLFQEVTAQVQKQAEIQRKKEEDVRFKLYIARWDEDRHIRESIRRGRARALWPKLMNYELRLNNWWFKLEDDLLKPFLLMCARPSVQNALAPYLTARFAGAWKEAYKQWSTSIPEDVLGRLEYLRNDDGRNHYTGPYSTRDKVHFSAQLLDSFKAFFQKYKEGGVVALALVNIAVYPQWCTWDIQGLMGDEGYYPGFNVLYLPLIENRKPWEVLVFLEGLTELLSGIQCETECAKFYESLNGTNPYHRKKLEMRDGCEFQTDLDDLVKFGASAGVFTRSLEERAEVKEIKELIGLNVWREHLDVPKNKWWDRSAGLIQAYLIARACDTVRFGKEVADVTFPEPSVDGVTTKEMTEFGASLVEMVRHKEKYREWPKYVPELVLPEHLDPRVLRTEDIRGVREACIKELKHGPQVVNEVARTIDEFARFCVLLAKPENHIKVRTGQYTERQVNARSEIDMVNEKARELVGLPIFMAYARVRQERDGEQALFKGRIRTLPLPYLEVGTAQEAFERNRVMVEENSRRYLKPRDQIRAEIEKRQERWRRKSFDGEPATRGEEKRGPPGAGGVPPSVTEPDEPPPGTRYKSGR